MEHASWCCLSHSSRFQSLQINLILQCTLTIITETAIHFCFPVTSGQPRKATTGIPGPEEIFLQVEVRTSGLMRKEEYICERRIITTDVGIVRRRDLWKAWDMANTLSGWRQISRSLTKILS